MKAYRTVKEDLLKMTQEMAFGADDLPQAASMLEHMTYDDGHIFPDVEALASLVTGLNPGFYRSLALVLKAEWEESFACGCRKWVPRSGEPLMPVLAEACEKDVRAADFNPDTARLFDLFDTPGVLTGRHGYNAGDFDTVVQQMLLSELHLVPNDGPEIAAFAAAETARFAMLNNATPEERQTFWSARCRWTQLQEKLDEVHVQIESRRLQNTETRRAWLVLFGEEEIALRDAFFRHCDLNFRKLEKEAHPELSEEELALKAAQNEDQHRKELNDLIFFASMAPELEHRLHAGTRVDFDQLREYKERAKTLLRQLRMKIHPDHLENDPAYRKLTDSQRKELDDLLRAALDVTMDELGMPAGFIEHDMRSVRALEAALARVDALLRNAGIDTRIEMVIQGHTLREQMEWINETCQSIERRIAAARAESHALATDPESKRQQGILDCPDLHDKIRQGLSRAAKEYSDKADVLAAEIERLFKRPNDEAAS